MNTDRIEGSLEIGVEKLTAGTDGRWTQEEKDFSLGSQMVQETTDYEAQIHDVVNDVETFVGFTASGRQRDFEPPWEKVTVRPVEIRGALHFQISYFDGKQDVTKNHTPGQFGEALKATLAVGFSNYHVQSEKGDLHVRITKRGKVLISRGRPSLVRDRHRLEHNRSKNYLLTPESGKDVLQAVGIVDSDGHIKPTMQAKFRQVNAFLKLLDEKLQKPGDDVIRIVDCGCGSAFLTLSAYAYLSLVNGYRVSLVGIDQNEVLIEKCRNLATRLGWEDVSFQTSKIADYVPDHPPSIVLSLHACDTATDEALSQAVHWGAGLILAAPCCQQELAGQVQSEVHRPVLRHGILKQRTADILTDALRAQLLQIVGYQSEVIEFISTEETSKNLMIRSERKLLGSDKNSSGQRRTGRRRGDVNSAVKEYQALKAFWGVTPSLETYLGDRVTDILPAESASAVK